MTGRIGQVLRRSGILAVALLASLVAGLYWAFIASDRYVSEAHIIIQRTDLTNGHSVDFGGLIGAFQSSSRADQLLLRDHLLSIDMLKKLDAKLNLRDHYSDSSHDLISRMWFHRPEIEWFHRHYLSRITVDFDELAGTLVIKAEAYDPKTAHAVAQMLVSEGERFMNNLAHTLAHDQVGFLEKQVSEISERVARTRQTVLDYQNRKGLVSPQGTAENLFGIVNRLENELADLKTRRAAMLAYLMPDSSGVVQLNQHIAAVEKQIGHEKARLAAPDTKALNRAVEEFQRLQMNAEFALDVYRTSLVALEKGRVEATRTLKKVSVLQSAFEPEYPIRPRRIYNTIVFILSALLVAGIMHLIGAIIRDHQD